MAIGTTAAIIMGISAGVSAYGAHKKASAAKDAAKTQVASAEQAKAELRPLYEQSVARLDPYAQLGGDAVGQLRALGGYGPAASLQPGGSAAPQWPQSLAQGATGLAARFAPNGSLAKPPPQGMSMGAFGQPVMGNQSSYGAPSQGGGSSFSIPQQGQPTMVRLVAPTGEQREVPEHLAAQLEQAGARRLN